MSVRPLSPRQRFALDIITGWITERGYPPTLRDLGRAMGIRSTNGVTDHLNALTRKGYIKRNDYLARGIQLVAEQPGVTALGVPAPGETPPRLESELLLELRVAHASLLREIDATLAAIRREESRLRQADRATLRRTAGAS